MVRLFNHYVSTHLLTQMLGDFLALFGTFSLVSMLLGEESAAVASPAILNLTMAGATVVIGFIVGLYPRGPIESGAKMWLLSAFSGFLALTVDAVAMSVASTSVAPSKPYFLSVVGATLLVVAFRAYSTQVRPRDRSAYRVMILGAGQAAQLVTRTLLTADRHAKIIGYYPSGADGDLAVPADSTLSTKLSLLETAKQERVQEIVVALTERRGASIAMSELLDCRANGIRVCDMSSYFERTIGQIRLDQLHAGWLVFGDGFNQGSLRTLIKRVFDIFAALLLLLLTLPVLAITAVLIVLDSRGPILYRQVRVGLHGRHFEVLKLRSMCQDAEKPGQPQWAVKADSRVTRVGRVIRVMRIDELPQLLNVLRGDMSLVGPRPERPPFVDTLTRDVPFYALRHSVKPGLTGWAQVRYQYGSSIDDAKEKLQFDLYYVKNHTLFLDLLVLLKTVNVVLTGKGAR